MKKSIIALMGLFALFACSDEALTLDQEKQSENPEIPMSVYTSDPNIPYDSPFDLYGSNVNMNVVPLNIENNTSLSIKIKPYFGSIYVDSNIDDGINFGYISGVDIPNLYPIGSTEYGHTVNSSDYWIPAYNSFSVVGGLYSQFGPNWPQFDMSAVPLINTSFEWNFLSELCKMYYFEYEVYDSNNNRIFSGTLKQKFGDDNLELSEVLNVGGWGYIGDLVNNPALALVSNEKTSEICLVGHRKEVMPSEETFHDPSTDTMHTIKFYTDANGVYIDVN